MVTTAKKAARAAEEAKKAAAKAEAEQLKQKRARVLQLARKLAEGAPIHAHTGLDLFADAGELGRLVVELFFANEKEV